MNVSWKWLNDYVALTATPAEVAERFTMSGLNLEEIRPPAASDDKEPVLDPEDLVIDLEVTSNRPDCLGHLGIAREACALYDLPLRMPAANPAAQGPATDSLVRVSIDEPELCPQYIARVIRGVKVGPSPVWLQARLQAVGVTPINNLVDITNYVMLECGQPLHAFDLSRVGGGQIVVRKARAGEKLTAINQREYNLTPEMLVIADAQRPVALAGVMGGLDSEISDKTVDVLIEAASFAPLSIRTTARALALHSPSSYRFERALDPAGPEWASRRCCELVLQLAGGTLCTGSVSAGRNNLPAAAPIRMRMAQCLRILGISIDSRTATQILTALGCQVVAASTGGVESGDELLVTPPSFRRDLTREIDLIEELARLNGYEKIPENVPVPLCASSKTRRDRVTERLRESFVGSGCYEALTVSFVSATDAEYFRPNPEFPLLTVEHSTRRHENVLRPSLIPSLLLARQYNERFGNFGVSLFELARVYLAADRSQSVEVTEPYRIGLVTGQSLLEAKGMIENVVARIAPGILVECRARKIPGLTPGRCADVFLAGEHWGWLGELPKATLKQLDLREATTIFEARIDLLERLANLTPKAQPLPVYQSVTRDLNFVLAESVAWQQLTDAIQQSAGPLLEKLAFGGQYRGQQIGDGKKSYLVELTYRNPECTLTAADVDHSVAAVVARCQADLQATLRA